MAKKIMEHPIAHEGITTEDRVIYIVVGVVVTLVVFLAMKVI